VEMRALGNDSLGGRGSSLEGHAVGFRYTRGILVPGRGPMGHHPEDRTPHPKWNRFFVQLLGVWLPKASERLLDGPAALAIFPRENGSSPA